MTTAKRTLKLLEENPDARPKPRKPSFAGRFRAGMQLNNRPVALSNWRVTTGDPEVADAIASLYGGKSESWETTKEDALQVLTEKDSVQVVINNADAVTFRMALYGMQGPIHLCDGYTFVDPEDAQFGKPCGCPADLRAKKDGAKAGKLPKPDIAVKFHLADAPDRGMFRLMTGSWDFLKTLETVWADLDAVGGPALCTLKLDLVDFWSDNLGKQITYRRPQLIVHGPDSSVDSRITAAERQTAKPVSLANVTTEDEPTDEPPF
ncbi:hypothetical protein AB0P37_08530 [Streptomyces antimycoticus]|uniref:recombination directionality factor n=1 Tax=Streptomyces antimycoticus TaxID=68175 RepID=UPI00343DD5F9